MNASPPGTGEYERIATLGVGETFTITAHDMTEPGHTDGILPDGEQMSFVVTEEGTITPHEANPTHAKPVEALDNDGIWMFTPTVEDGVDTLGQTPDYEFQYFRAVSVHAEE